MPGKRYLPLFAYMLVILWGASAACPRPDLPPHAVIVPDKPEYGYGELVRIYCRDSSGSHTVTQCMGDVIHFDPPQCNGSGIPPAGVPCLRPDLPANVVIAPDKPVYNNLEFITMSCTSATEDRTKITQCQNGVFGGQPPQCDSNGSGIPPAGVPCPRPDLPANVVIAPDKPVYNNLEFITMSCTSATEDRTKITQCQNGVFGGQPPQCDSNGALPTADYSTCGKRSSTFSPISRIFGGTAAANGSWPWMAMIYRRSIIIYSFLCGGSILSNRWILTSAQCVAESSSGSLRVYVGGHRLNTFLSQEQRRDVSLTHQHPSYTPDQHLYGYDVGLLYLRTSITFNEIVRPICLPPGTNYAISPKTKCYFAGWGRTYDGSDWANQLREADLTVESRSYCQDKYKRFLGALNSMPSTIMCAGPSNKDICKGDGGGPLMCDVGDNTWYQYGIGSFGEVGCRSGPSFFAKVDEVYDWIQRVTSLDFSPPKDVNECEQIPNPCGDRQCINQVGGYTCNAGGQLRMRGIWVAAVAVATSLVMNAMN